MTAFCFFFSMQVQLNYMWEAARASMPPSVIDRKWFVFSDDDTYFLVENLLQKIRQFQHTKTPHLLGYPLAFEFAPPEGKKKNRIIFIYISLLPLLSAE